MWGWQNSLIGGPPRISETTRARKLKFYTHLDGLSALFENENFSARVSVEAQCPSVSLGPPHISKTIGGRKLKFESEHASDLFCNVIKNVRNP